MGLPFSSSLNFTSSDWKFIDPEVNLLFRIINAKLWKLIISLEYSPLPVSIISCASSYVNLRFELITVFPNHWSKTSALSFILKTAEKVNFSSFGLREQTIFDNFSGSIGITLSTRYIEVALS